MIKRLLLKSVVAAAALVGSATAVRADFVIDDFSAPAPGYSFSLNAAGPTVTIGTDSLAGGITRSATAQLLVLDETPNGGGLGDSGSSKRFTLNTASGSTAIANLSYTYSTPQNLSAAGTDLQMVYSFADLNVPFSVTISDGTNSKTLSSVAASGGGTYRFSMADFTGIDLTNVSSIGFALNQDLLGVNPTVTSADFTVRDIRILTPPPVDPPAVPAPAGVVLLLAAAPALGLYRLRRKPTA